jgi:putative transposase
VRQAARESGVARSSVQRCFELFGLKPQRSESFRLSTDAFFIEKPRDVVKAWLARRARWNIDYHSHLQLLAE